MLWHMYTYWCYRFVRYATKYQVTYENRKLPTYYAVWTGRQVCKYAWCGDNVATGTNEIVGTWTCYRLIVGTVLLQYVPRYRRNAITVARRYVVRDIMLLVSWPFIRWFARRHAVRSMAL